MCSLKNIVHIYLQHMHYNDLLKQKDANKLEDYVFNYISWQNYKKRKFLIQHFSLIILVVK